MSGSTGAVVAVLALLGIGGAVALVSSSSSSKAAPSPGPGPSNPATQWVRATTINPGDDVRASIALPDLTTVAQAFGVAVDAQGLESILASPAVAAALQYGGGAAAGVQIWAPTDPTLPTDWPTDDPNPHAEYHIAFAYGGAAPLVVGMSPIPMIVWTRKIAGIPHGGTGGVFHVPQGGGTGATAAGSVPTNPVLWGSLAIGQTVAKGAWVRFSLTPSQLVSMLFAAGAQSSGTTTVQATTLQSVLAGSAYITPGTISVWAPGAGLPADWPTNEPSASANFHVQYQAAQAFPMGGGETQQWVSFPAAALQVNTGQQVTAATGGSYTASAIAGGLLQVTAPGPIQSIVPAAAGAVKSSSMGGDVASIQLSGQAGAVTVTWRLGQHGSASAVVNVS